MKKLSQRSVDVDLVGVDASIVNTFRRILSAEVPTIANVYVFNNTSVTHDETLSHRLGLIPLNIDPRLFEFRPRLLKAQRRVPARKKGAERRRPQIDDWRPRLNPPAGTNKDIVLAKLAPEQVIEIEMHAVKGLGKENAKWSAVATVSYGLHPLVILNPSKPVPREHGEKFARCFNPGVAHVGAHGEGFDRRAQPQQGDDVARNALA